MKTLNTLHSPVGNIQFDLRPNGIVILESAQKSPLMFEGQPFSFRARIDPPNNVCRMLDLSSIKVGNARLHNTLTEMLPVIWRDHMMKYPIIKLRLDKRNKMQQKAKHIANLQAMFQRIKNIQEQIDKELNLLNTL